MRGLRVVRGCGVSLAIVLMALALLSPPAGATCGPVFAPGPSTYTIYFAGELGGGIQCAGRRTRYWRNDTPFGSVASATAWSNARKDLFCANAFGLPAGWITAGSIVQARTTAGGPWTNIDISPTAANLPGSANTPSPGTEVQVSVGYYDSRAVSVHQTLSAGAWRTDIHWITC